MKKILYIVDFLEASNETLQVAEGLIYHPKVEAYFTADVNVLGKELAKAIPTNKIKEVINQCDYVITHTERHASFPRTFEIISETQAWPKTVIWDLHDVGINADLKQKSAAYFSREWEKDSGVYPLDLCLLEGAKEYMDSLGELDRNIDLGFYYSPLHMSTFASSYQKRMRLFEQLRSVDWGENSLVGRDFRRWAGSPNNWDASRELYTNPNTHSTWSPYINCLKRTKVGFQVFATYSQSARLWEMMYSGALYFLDVNKMPHEFPFENGKDCFIYDASDSVSITNAIEKAKHYLKPNMKEEREAIAQSGKELVNKHHTSVSRMDYILKILRR